MKRTTKHTHFTLETRLFIEDELDNGSTITEISKNYFVIEAMLAEKFLNIKLLNFLHHSTEITLVNII